MSGVSCDVEAVRNPAGAALTSCACAPLADHGRGRGVATSDSADSSSSQLQRDVNDGVDPMLSASSRSEGFPSTCQPGALPRSAKRKAAEALLAARHSLAQTSAAANATLALVSGHQHKQLRGASQNAGIGARQAPGSGRAAANAQQQAAGVALGKSSVASGHDSSVLVKGCSLDCSCQQSGSRWCKHDVRIPHIKWPLVFDSNPATYYSFLLGKGYERIYMPENLQVYVVKNPAHITSALQVLKASMQDRVIAMDLEWVPRFKPIHHAHGAGKPQQGLQGESPVAVMQLASATTCLVLQVSCMSYVLPEEVKQFLMDDSITLVGFSWDSADEAKMTNTFGLGRASFADFVDLQAVAHQLGYHRLGLAGIARQVMGLTMMKSKKVSCSNWAAHHLTMQQIKYASMDVFITGQVFRGLRLWHSSPSPCPSCQQPVGAQIPASLICSACSTQFSDWPAYRDHCITRGHTAEHSLCTACGRVHMAVPPGGRGAAETPATKSRLIADVSR